ncbi:MAG: glycosyl hydrolase family 8 [Bacillota bacterium]
MVYSKKALKNKSKVIITFIIVSLIFLKISYREVKLGIHWTDYPKTYEEQLCYQFVAEMLSSPTYGIYTNYLEDSSFQEDEAKGHQILSESEGLMMLYSVKANEKKVFDQHAYVVSEYMVLPNHLFRWRIDRNGEKISESSAAIDDLRIIRALLLAYDRWGDRQYKGMLFKATKAVQKYEVDNNQLVDFYDSNSKEKASSITLAYIDLYTMDLLSKIDASWEKVEANGKEVILRGKISEDMPFYHKTFDYKTRQYHVDEFVNMIDTMMILKHLSEVGECPDDAILWLIDQMKTKGGVYLRYHASSGEAMSTMESTAVYALGAQIAVNIKNDELYEMMINKMLRYQIYLPSSGLYGAFGDEIKQEVYSFDNLNALLAFRKDGE